MRHPARTPRPDGAASPLPALVAAALAVVGLVLTGVVALLVPAARIRDSAALQGFRGLDDPQLNPVLDTVAHLADPAPYALLGLALVAVAVARRRPRTAIAVAGLLVITGLTTRAMKVGLAHPRFTDWLGDGQIADASWPSGHATASMTLGLCLVLVLPRRLRPAGALLAAAFALAVSTSILALAWHFPSDVVGGFFNAALWTSLAVAALLALERRFPTAREDPPPRRADVLAPAAVGVAALLAGAAGLLASRPDVAEALAARPSFAAGAAALVALAGAIAVSVVRADRV